MVWGRGRPYPIPLRVVGVRMKGLNALLTSYLDSHNLTLRDLKKKRYKSQKNELLDKLLSYTVLQKKTQKQALKDIRSLDLSFADNYARGLYRKHSLDKRLKSTTRYHGKLNLDAKPNLDRLPYVTIRWLPDGSLLYGVTVYLNCKDKKKNKNKSKEDTRKSIPRKAVRIGYEKKYNTISDYSFVSEKVLTKREINKIFTDMFLGVDVANVYGSDTVVMSTNSRDIDFKICDVVGFVFNRSFRTTVKDVD